jgi:hypothetical protein
VGIALALLAVASGCWHVHHDYLTFSLSGQYEAWAEGEGLLVLYPPLNPFWWLGLLALLVDLVIAPFTMLHDLAVYLSATPGSLPPPWELHASPRW